VSSLVAGVTQETAIGVDSPPSFIVRHGARHWTCVAEPNGTRDAFSRARVEKDQDATIV
jgi:hypothetical protein